MLCWNVRSFHAGKSGLLRWAWQRQQAAIFIIADTVRGWEAKVSFFVIYGSKEKLLGLEPLLLLAGSCVQFPVAMWKLTSIYSTSCRGSNVFFWSP